MLFRVLAIAGAMIMIHVEAVRCQSMSDTTGIDRLLMAQSATVQTRRVSEQQRANEERRASDWRKISQVTGGFLGASVVGLAAWSIFDDPTGHDRQVKGDAGYTPAANTAYAIGSYIGGTLLIYLVGRGDGSRSSIVSTAIGSGLATIPLLFGRNEPYLPILGVVIAAPLQAIGGTIGYQRSRRPAPQN